MADNALIRRVDALEKRVADLTKSLNDLKTKKVIKKKKTTTIKDN